MDYVVCTNHDLRIACILITKERYFHKPTYDTLKQALLDLTRQCMENQIVSAMIQEIFADTDFEILVCYQ